MDKSTFNLFWDEIISPSIDKCQKDVSKKEKQMLNLSGMDKEKYKNHLHALYKRKREWLKREYLPAEGKSAVLDFHKLSAIMCRCIIGRKYFSFSVQDASEFYRTIEESNKTKTQKLEKEIDTIYINYKLAFLVSAGINYFDLLYKSKRIQVDEIDNYTKELLGNFIERLKENSQLFFYQKSSHHDDFKSSIIVSLMKNDRLMRDFDYLGYAALMFQWQEYTKDQIFFEILKNQPNAYATIVNLRHLF